MTPIVFSAADGILAAVASTSIAGIVSLIKMMVRLNKNVDKLVVMDTLRATDLEALSKVQHPMLVGIRASLEAQRDGKCNGKENI